ncbi:hypothetical protein FIU97_07935 [Roseivivax sp. THAF40]|uniref:DUF6314 family protein n=1 Tax=unclassified Roseivivax TaxID=2639302 RepID=UPI0012A7BEB4|nr:MULTISPECIES: DUF6314 family protein [unclassified Roseivivax]QFS82727.1 hypothetical protein FIV09_07830 [Roseivivax sp. THAF197b]QFT46496.1 hypothetical protein FIU97_07935 [Roseivivax sp. THAF40]
MSAHLPARSAPDLPVELFDFEGVWRFRRKIMDRKLGQISQGQGTLRMVRDGAHLHYEECVTLDLPGQPPIEGTRRYLWRPAPRGIEVLFEDGRPFHRIRLPEPAPRDTHHCDPDLYRVHYDLSDWPVWSQVWEVTGPRKDYRIDTLFVRDRAAEQT